MGEIGSDRASHARPSRRRAIRSLNIRDDQHHLDIASGHGDAGTDLGRPQTGREGAVKRRGRQARLLLAIAIGVGATLYSGTIANGDGRGGVLVLVDLSIPIRR